MSDETVVADEIAVLPVEDFEFDSNADVLPADAGTNRIPINTKHIRLLVNQFKKGRQDFVRLARLSKCRVVSADDPDAPAWADFTAFGVLPGQSLTPAQVKLVYYAWLGRKAELENND